MIAQRKKEPNVEVRILLILWVSLVLTFLPFPSQQVDLNHDNLTPLPRKCGCPYTECGCPGANITLAPTEILTPPATFPIQATADIPDGATVIATSTVLPFPTFVRVGTATLVPTNFPPTIVRPPDTGN